MQQDIHGWVVDDSFSSLTKVLEQLDIPELNQAISRISSLSWYINISAFFLMMAAALLMLVIASYLSRYRAAREIRSQEKRKQDHDLAVAIAGNIKKLADAPLHEHDRTLIMAENIAKLVKTTEITLYVEQQCKFANYVYSFVTRRKELAIQKKTECFFCVYHPATDWHGPFSQFLRLNPIDGLICYSNNMDEIREKIIQQRIFRNGGVNDICYILFPSTKAYTAGRHLYETTRGLKYVVLVGQFNDAGQPHVSIELPAKRHVHTEGINVLTYYDTHEPDYNVGSLVPDPDIEEDEAFLAAMSKE